MAKFVPRTNTEKNLAAAAIRCPRCGGSGRKYNNAGSTTSAYKIKCPLCKGSGKR